MAAVEMAHRAKRRALVRGEPNVSLTLFFVFMFTNFAIYSLMFCTLPGTLIGMGLLSVALLLAIGTYLAGA
jgi:hypothetical protein